MMFLSSMIAENFDLIWTNIFFYLFAISSIISFIVILICAKRIANKNDELKLIQSQHSAKVDIIRKENADKFEELRGEMLKKEEERTRQWMESEKETLIVLNGVSQVLELSENISKIESEKILSKLDEIKEIIENKKNDHEKNGETKRG